MIGPTRRQGQRPQPSRHVLPHPFPIGRIRARIRTRHAARQAWSWFMFAAGVNWHFTGISPRLHLVFTRCPQPGLDEEPSSRCGEPLFVRWRAVAGLVVALPALSRLLLDRDGTALRSASTRGDLLAGVPSGVCRHWFDCSEQALVHHLAARNCSRTGMARAPTAEAGEDLISTRCPRIPSIRNRTDPAQSHDHSGHATCSLPRIRNETPASDSGGRTRRARCGHGPALTSASPLSGNFPNLTDDRLRRDNR